MNPEEMELRILYAMYCQHFKSGGLANATDRGIAVEAKLEDIDPNELRGEIDYLAKKDFLKIGGRGESGYQLFIGLEPKGVETMQIIADKSMRILPEELKDQQFRAKLNEIASEKDPIKRTRNFFDTALQNRDCAKHVFNIARQVLLGSELY